MIVHTDKPIKYHLAEDTIDERDVDALAAWLKGYPRLTKGPLTPEFEAAWSAWLGAEHSVFCNSGSSANLLMYYAMLRSGRLRNMKVVVPSVGWVTSVAPAMQLGFTPLMCEADPDTYGLDLDHLERLLKEHDPALVLMVQVLGVPHKMDELMKLKERFGFTLLEDACAAAGAAYKGRKVGTFGELASFSAYFGHQFSTIEGGLVSTSDAALHELLLMHRSHGWSKDLSPGAHEALVKKHGIDDFHTPFVFYEAGFNLRATDLQAFIGLGQVKKMDWIASRRRENHALFAQRLAGKLDFQRPPEGSTVCSISFGALAKDGAQRRRIVAALAANGIETRIFSAGNLGLHPFWTERYGPASFPMADRIHHCGFFLPNNPSLKPADVDFICGVVTGAL
ncbi:MAG: DegT/DnrJ/EryC1/StrS family aminotransferase [Elusimicrobia bacterium]|nr:DegT/DnrJ/EryC1/StrS family aminotransferase [Elusimicrobiota bacterium]